MPVARLSGGLLNYVAWARGSLAALEMAMFSIDPGEGLASF